jgi:hypothetical protein
MMLSLSFATLTAAAFRTHLSRQTLLGLAGLAGVRFLRTERGKGVVIFFVSSYPPRALNGQVRRASLALLVWRDVTAPRQAFHLLVLPCLRPPISHANFEVTIYLFPVPGRRSVVPYPNHLITHKPPQPWTPCREPNPTTSTDPCSASSPPNPPPIPPPSEATSSPLRVNSSEPSYSSSQPTWAMP